MQARGDSEAVAGRAVAEKPKALAFYLPQYHPIPENDEWWGRGFTEWHNVAKARPLFPGHYQPHLPGELGYYDLRLPEVREAQAQLARQHGIHGFVYYHYWFHGRRLLERPFEEVLSSGEPDLPFALCWANEEWTRGWDAQTGHVLMRQEYSEADDRAHIRHLIKAFEDPRYITIDGRPLMLIYRPTLVPNLERTAEIWRTEVQRAGFPDLYLCWVESWGPPPGGKGPVPFGLDASVGFMPVHSEQLHHPLETLRGHRILDYETAAQSALKLVDSPWKRFPSVMVSWDNTARRARGATIYHGATPERYEQWLRATADAVAEVRPEENYLFILAWNEWAEGNHLEPDQRYGRAYLEATRAVLAPGVGAMEPSHESAHRQPGAHQTPQTRADTHRHVQAATREITANVAALLAGLEISAGRRVIDLADRAASVPRPALEYPGLDVVAGTFTDPASLKETLGEVDDVGAVLLVDVLQHLADPQELLAALAAWSLEHGSPPLLITAPHVAHIDTALQILCGRFEVQEAGPLDPANLRFFTEDTLRRLVERSGWRVAGRNDAHSLYSGHYDPELRDSLPEEMVGALHATAEAFNPNWSVTNFVWTLEPDPFDMAPTSYGEAVSPAGPAQPADAEARRAVSDYLASVGLVVSEVNRRAVLAYRAQPGNGVALSRPKQVVLRIAYGSPRREAAFKRLYARLRPGSRPS